MARVILILVAVLSFVVIFHEAESRVHLARNILTGSDMDTLKGIKMDKQVRSENNSSESSESSSESSKSSESSGSTEERINFARSESVESISGDSDASEPSSSDSDSGESVPSDSDFSDFD